ncbi:hypothetical protein FEE95_07770 [Maribacter algarum]|uniref:DUF1772 domain-containing protein n=2 Tax=Maribacter algarum (ex Zhang et al. 2020) TaxID=2578118 RepID=A0A5S3QNX4_9FLAO|nr:hypothetical protein FEE95_07770 [Maribacter algarum]
MSLGLFRLVFDSGLLILIWMVQLIVYPSIQYYTSQNLLNWHQKYTVAISFVVIPLMFGQLITASLQLISERNLFTLGSLILIGLVWASTFIQFVPMHSAIASGNTSPKLLQKLVSKNWIRTILWTLIFVWTVIKSL